LNKIDVSLYRGFTIELVDSKIGFEQICFSVYGNQIHYEAEGMSKQFIKRALEQMVDDSIFDE